MKKVCVPSQVDIFVLRRDTLHIKKPGTQRVLTAIPQNGYCIFKIWRSLGWSKNWRLIVLGTRSLKDLLPALNELIFVDLLFSLLF